MKDNEPDALMGRMNSPCISCRIVAVMIVFALSRRRFRQRRDGTPLGLVFGGVCRAMSSLCSQLRSGFLGMSVRGSSNRDKRISLFLS